MSAFTCMHGKLVIVGKSPDGDSIRFVADDPSLFTRLAFHYRIRLSSDKSVQLRFEAIDAPETHFEHQSQPLGVIARDLLLKRAGFAHVAYEDNGTVLSASPASVPGYIITKMVEANGRPVAYVGVGQPPVPDGTAVHDPTPYFAKTLNTQMLDSGLAYLTLYTSTPAAHRAFFVDRAQAARSRDEGVWAQDKTAHFTLHAQTSIGPNGVLILPKLFRRCTDYLAAQRKGFTGTLPQWLISTMQQQNERLQENDAVWVGREQMRLSDLIGQKGAEISFSADLLTLVFVEK